MNKITAALLIGIAVAAVLLALSATPPKKEPTQNIIPLVIPESTMPSCIPEGSLIPAMPNPPPCCSGLIAVNYAETDEYGGCMPDPLPFGESFCVNCGNGECDMRESPCSCPQDCVFKPGDVRAGFGNASTELANLEDSMASLLSESYPQTYADWVASGSDLLDWTYSNITLYRDLLAAVSNPAGMTPYLKPGEAEAAQPVVENKTILQIVTKQDAISVLEPYLGLDMREDSTTMVDIGNAWTVCSTYGPATNRTKTCCQLPKQYEEGSELECSSQEL